MYAVHRHRRRLAMKAIVQDRFGPPEVLELRAVPDPVVGENDVLVQVRAAGCGPDVWHIMAGKPYLVRMMPELRKMMRLVRGWDVAGQVEAARPTTPPRRPLAPTRAKGKRVLGPPPWGAGAGS